MRQKINLIAVVLVLIFAVSCGDSNEKKNTNTENQENEQHAKEELKKDAKDVHWSHHEGEDGPENWKNLCDEFKDCGGSSQSPIDIITKDMATGKDLLKPEFNYEPSKVTIVNNGHTVQLNIEGNNTVKLNNKDYKLLQLHYHALSEHTIDGNHSPIEVHFVHKYSDTDFAVIGVMCVQGKENELLKKYLYKLPKSKGEFKPENLVDIFKILPENKSYYNYSGSLTTPPCTEVVNWYVLKNPIEASQEQIEAFSKILNNNYRPVQALNGREVKQYVE